MREKLPNASEWVELAVPASARVAGEFAQSWWRAGAVVVGSLLTVAKYPSGEGSGPQWLVSVSDDRTRPSRTVLRRALRAFDMLGAEEDNHHPGIARHFWRPVDPSRRVDCECKTDETLVVEPGGYRWTNPVEGPCRGCELRGLTGRPCPLHKETTP